MFNRKANGKGECREHKTYLTEKLVAGELTNVFDPSIFDKELIELVYQSKKEESTGACAYLNESIIDLQGRLKPLESARSRF